MPYGLSPNIAISNATRLVVVRVDEVQSNPNDPDTVVELRTFLELRSAPATDRFYGRYMISTRNSATGPSDRLRLRPTTPGNPDEFLPGMSNEDVLHVQHGALSLASGLTTVLNAWRGGTTGARKNALLTALASLGQIDAATLPGTVS